MSVFVDPEVIRLPLDLPEQPDAWIEVKRELTVGELRRMQAAGITYMSGADTAAASGDQSDVKMGIDMARMALAKAQAFIVDWNLRGKDGKEVPYKPSTVPNLKEAVFAKIEAAIDQHRELQAKNAAKTGSEKPEPSS